MLICAKVFGSSCISLFVLLVFFAPLAHRAKIHVLTPRTTRVLTLGRDQFSKNHDEQLTCDNPAISKNSDGLRL
jgi:hypothetical protein